MKGQVKSAATEHNSVWTTEFDNPDLVDKIVTHVTFETLAVTVLQLNRAFCDAAQQRLRCALPLLAPPFRMQPRQILESAILNLSGRHLGDDDVSAIASACASGALAQLKTLVLHENQIGDAGVTALAEACAGGAMAQLQELHLEINQIGDAGVTALANACAGGAMAQLKNLYLHQNQLGDAGVTALANACAGGAMASLKELVMDDGPLGVDHPKLKSACQKRGITLR